MNLSFLCFHFDHDLCYVADDLSASLGVFGLPPLKLLCGIPSPPLEERARERRPLHRNDQSLLKFGAWSFFGAWCLDFGVSLELGDWVLELSAYFVR
jgi:hypothetical protein